MKRSLSGKRRKRCLGSDVGCFILRACFWVSAQVKIAPTLRADARGFRFRVSNSNLISKVWPVPRVFRFEAEVSTRNSALSPII